MLRRIKQGENKESNAGSSRKLMYELREIVTREYLRKENFRQKNSSCELLEVG